MSKSKDKIECTEINALLLPTQDKSDSTSHDSTNTTTSSGPLEERLLAFAKKWFSFLFEESGDKENATRSLLVITFFGALVGIIIAPTRISKDESDVSWYTYFSSILGYIYFLSWSTSFYPQVFLNYNRKETSGLSVDFTLLNVVGFACLSAYNVCFYWSKYIQKEYSDLHDGKPNLVQSNDVAFALHAFFLSCISLSQIVYYDVYIHKRKRVPSKATILFLTIAIIYLSYLAIAISFVDPTSLQESKSHYYTWINFLYILTYIKMFITFIKYLPQIYLNYKEKSTEGWNIYGIIFDFYGGVTSLLQLLLDCFILENGDFSEITGDLVKFMLSIISIFFDVSTELTRLFSFLFFLFVNFELIHLYFVYRIIF